jgi:predicted lipoprotein
MKGAGAVGAVVALALVATSACRVATVRRLDEKGALEDAPTAANKPFDAVAFVDSIWRSEVLHSLDEARETAEVVGSAAGLGTNGSRPAPVVVRGRGRVVSVDTRSRSGSASVELDGPSRAVVVVQVGPVINGTAIRDALPALGFDRFLNQIQHADVGNELNARVERDVLGRLDRSSLRGRQVRFAGMATFEEGRPLTVTPVRLEVESRP